MADNYLEKRYAEVFGGAPRPTQGSSLTAHKSLETLIRRNRSYRGYDTSYTVHIRQLRAIADVCTRVPSGMNAQRLRFKLVTDGPQADGILGLVHFGGALPELHLPFPGTEPKAFIVACSTVGENPIVDIDLGICLQTMLLKAVDLGLGGIILRSFDRTALKDLLGLTALERTAAPASPAEPAQAAAPAAGAEGQALEPLAVLAIGKPAEKIELVPAAPGSPLSYWREDGIHYVPKLQLDDLLIG